MALACAAPGDSSPKKPTEYRGMLVVDDDLRTFEPCDGGPTVWVAEEGGGDVFEVQRALVAAGNPDSRIYVDVLATSGPPPSDGRGADYPAQITVTALRFAHPAGEGPGCADTPERWSWRASGNEPFWTVIVTPEEATLRTPEDPAGIEFGHLRTEESDDAVTLVAGSAESAMRLTLTPGACRDTMSGAWHAWSAHLIVGDRDLRGCGRQGSPPGL